MSLQLFAMDGRPIENLLFATLAVERCMTTTDGFCVVERNGRCHAFKADKGAEIIGKISERARPLVRANSVPDAMQMDFSKCPNLNGEVPRLDRSP
eukprot:SAG11_NODE_6993_length_1211_cov_0.686433_2_plen_96_part_00